jgi:signal transduction histidine kinase
LELTMVLSEPGCGDCYEAAMASAERQYNTLIRIVNEQAIARRTAMLVAHGLPPEMVFREVAGAIGSAHSADYSLISRYEPDQTMSVVAFWAAPDTAGLGIPAELRWEPGLRWKMDESTCAAETLRTGKPVRRPSDQIGGDVGHWVRSLGAGHVLACPIKIRDEVWGEMALLYRGLKPPPEDTEQQVSNFVELAGCTIAQAESRTELIASRARLVKVFDAARRGLERDLHDGVQQRLVSLGLQLREAQARVPSGQRALEGHLQHIDEDLAEIMRQVHEISHGLRPALLASGGLTAALPSLARCSKIPVEFDINLPDPLNESTEMAIYYFVAESLTNVAKHSNAGRATVQAGRDDDVVWVAIHDDGNGGANPRRGSGIVGLQDRVEALGGTFKITSPPGEGTAIRATVPA